MRGRLKGMRASFSVNNTLCFCFKRACWDQEVGDKWKFGLFLLELGILSPFIPFLSPSVAQMDCRARQFLLNFTLPSNKSIFPDAETIGIASTSYREEKWTKPKHAPVCPAKDKDLNWFCQRTLRFNVQSILAQRYCESSWHQQKKQCFGLMHPSVDQWRPWSCYINWKFIHLMFRHARLGLSNVILSSYFMVELRALKFHGKRFSWTYPTNPISMFSTQDSIHSSVVAEASSESYGEIGKDLPLINNWQPQGLSMLRSHSVYQAASWFKAMLGSIRGTHTLIASIWRYEKGCWSATWALGHASLSFIHSLHRKQGLEWIPFELAWGDTKHQA